MLCIVPFLFAENISWKEENNSSAENWKVNNILGAMGKTI